MMCIVWLHKQDNAGIYHTHTHKYTHSHTRQNQMRFSVHSTDQNTDGGKGGEKNDYWADQRQRGAANCSCNGFSSALLGQNLSLGVSKILCVTPSLSFSLSLTEQHWLLRLCSSSPVEHSLSLIFCRDKGELSQELSQWKREWMM